MAQELYKLPFPSSGYDNVGFRQLVGQTCCLEWDDDDGVPIRFIFVGVEAFKATYYNACTSEMIEAYDKICDMGQTIWLTEVQGQLERRDKTAIELRHLRSYFDYGPCYEFICKGFHIDERKPAV